MAVEMPEEVRTAFEQLARLDKGQRTGLRESLAEATPYVSAEHFASEVRQVDGIPPAGQSAIIQMLVNLYGILERSGADAFTVAQSVVRSAVNEDVAGLQDRPELVQELSEYLSTLLELSRSIGFTFKAGEVSLENANNFGSAKVISNLRPIFLRTAGLEPQAALAVHLLKIEIHDKDESYVFALDVEDIVSLQATLQRALDKEHALRQIATASDLTWVTR